MRFTHRSRLSQCGISQSPVSDARVDAGRPARRIAPMPRTIQPRHANRADASAVCGECRGFPPDSGDGTGRCPACGAILVCPDPAPNEVLRLTLVPCDADLRPLPRRERRFTQVEWGERTPGRWHRRLGLSTHRSPARSLRREGHIRRRHRLRARPAAAGTLRSRLCQRRARQQRASASPPEVDRVLRAGGGVPYLACATTVGCSIPSQSWSMRTS